MASQACIDAVKDAGVTLDDIDLIICASGGADSGIPDDAPRIQVIFLFCYCNNSIAPSWTQCERSSCIQCARHLLRIRGKKIQDTYKFINKVGLHTAALYIQSGLYKNVLVVCSENPDLEWGVEPNQPQTAAILGMIFSKS